MSEGKQFNYQCRCCFLEVILYVISKNVASFGCCSLVHIYDNALFLLLLFETDIQRTNWGFT